MNAVNYKLSFVNGGTYDMIFTTQFLKSNVKHTLPQSPPPLQTVLGAHVDVTQKYFMFNVCMLVYTHTLSSNVGF
jgi:hypothetical protein